MSIKFIYLSPTQHVRRCSLSLINFIGVRSQSSVGA